MAEAARAFGVNRSTVYRLYKDGRLEVRRGTRAVLVVEAQVSGEVCDDFNTNACGTCSASCSAPSHPTAPTGAITTVDGANLANGETFTVGDGIHPPVMLSF
jgi:hypothetical protein